MTASALRPNCGSPVTLDRKRCSSCRRRGRGGRGVQGRSMCPPRCCCCCACCCAHLDGAELGEDARAARPARRGGGAREQVDGRARDTRGRAERGEEARAEVARLRGGGVVRGAEEVRKTRRFPPIASPCRGRRGRPRGRRPRAGRRARGSSPRRRTRSRRARRTATTRPTRARRRTRPAAQWVGEGGYPDIVTSPARPCRPPLPPTLRPMTQSVSSESTSVMPTPPQLSWPVPDCGLSSSRPHALDT